MSDDKRTHRLKMAWLPQQMHFYSTFSLLTLFMTGFSVGGTLVLNTIKH